MNPVPYTNAITNINSLKQCDTNSTSQGCIGSSTSTEATEPGFTMQNGASLAGFRTTSQVREVVVLDWNGAAGTNTLGDDQMVVAINYNQTAQYNGANKCNIAAYSGDAPSVTLYQTIFN